MSDTSDNPAAAPTRTTHVGIRRQSRVVTWRRRFLNVRTVVAMVVLLSLIAPGVAAIIDAVI